jgi:oxygen-independent coproporphyrinogen-3 oxidase
MRYTSEILAQISYWREKLGRVKISTIFFGGGTPSLMPTKNFAQIMNAVRENFDMAADAEITLEANPKTLDTTRLREFISGGVNRISIGVQSLNDNELQFLGRIHGARDALDLINAALGEGLRVSADFIYGLPGQGADDIHKMCGDINALGLEHASLYELTIEPNTLLARQNPKMPDNETMATMYEIIGTELSLPRYEVSNYGTPCVHNQNVWDGAPYIGLGDGAAGRVFMSDDWYETRVKDGKIISQKLSTRERAIEKVLTGLRTTRGVLLTDDVIDVIKYSDIKISALGGGVDFCISKNTGRGNTQRLFVNNFLLLDSILVKLIK